MQLNRLLVVDNSLVSVWVYPGRRMIHHHMKAYCHGDAFREALTRGVEAMEQHGATRWLSDDRLNGGVPPDDVHWANTVWLPRSKAAGWTHWGIVQPDKIIGRIHLTRISALYTEHGIVARFFTDPDEAMGWLDAA
jgi:hypothetical protein